jgi:HAD superfamily hydrolase (TIGR01484 family)
MKKLLAFDLDDTLAITKTPISDRMAEVLGKILEQFDVCVISGAHYKQFEIQITSRLQLDDTKLARLHLMPTCGTRYYRYDSLDHEWKLQYAEDLTEEQKTRIREVLERNARQLGLWENNPAGEVIEDRLSQMTYSALGQQATAEDKYAWDQDGSKKLALRDAAARELTDLEVRAGGTTSVDVTRVGIDKAYGMRKIMEKMGWGKEDILYFGDKLEEGGNDYPVKAFGIDSLEVSRWEDTALRLESILAAIK